MDEDRARAVELAMRGRWADAADANRQIVERGGAEVRDYNRLGRALTELGRIGEAREAYEAALRLEPHDHIAQRCLADLAQAGAAAAPDPALSAAFVSEPGRSAAVRVDDVVQAARPLLRTGERVQLLAAGEQLVVATVDGTRIGRIGSPLGERLARLLDAGNRYEARIISHDGEVRLMIRETFRAPLVANRSSFAVGRARGVDYGLLEAIGRDPSTTLDDYFELFEEPDEEPEADEPLPQIIELTSELADETGLEEDEGAADPELLEEVRLQAERDRAFADEEERDRR